MYSHTPLTPIDDEHDEHDGHLFYTSDENMVQRISIEPEGSQLGPLDIAAMTPKGNITTVIWKGKILVGGEQIIVFHQPQIDNVITWPSSDPSTNVLAAARSTITRSGKNRTLSGSVISEMLLRFE